MYSPHERRGLKTTASLAGVCGSTPPPPSSKLPVSVTNVVEECGLLADSARSFVVDRGDEGLVVRLIGSQPDPVASVVRLKIKGQPEPLEAPASAEDR
jgi:hypothetical protein